jgi:hypothetical protein
MGQVFLVFNPDIKKGFTEFGKSMHGYLTNEAILHAPESRTSSPVRIPRDPISYEHVQIRASILVEKSRLCGWNYLPLMEKCAVMIGESLNKKIATTS